ncbi:MAG: hypothetical protein Q611_LSC00368G0002 [Leuconostoc sp. DORA_2]|jgi:hypothetical protein|nr:MAG: hypothetical protein Q611_LSC00368G0002 [Leuconostoc sp. DORA_2]CCF24941.1 Protein of unknown function [Leuconostoc citreum LBAE C10]CCF26690.1 Protein of unknown function [Leuconostoc citreum LBAE C11]CCF28864.1 Protein of unknown function [Leuconostoc citreum LBAE E16]CDX63869.1 Protein of unknown function [Leuconostoc citreum]
MRQSMTNNYMLCDAELIVFVAMLRMIVSAGG